MAKRIVTQSSELQRTAEELDRNLKRLVQWHILKRLNNIRRDLGLSPVVPQEVMK